MVVAVVVPVASASLTPWSPDAERGGLLWLWGELTFSSGQIDWWCFLQLFSHCSELCPFPKHVKTLLAITINGLKVGTPECDSDDCCCRALGEAEEKKKASKRQGFTPSSYKPWDSKHPASISTATDAAVQTEQDQLESANVSNLASTVADEVAVATTLLNLVTDSQPFHWRRNILTLRTVRKRKSCISDPKL